MIVISGITISNPSGNLNSVVVEILDSGSTVIETMIYSGQSIIEYSEPTNGIYYVRITDGTSSVGCELTKTIYAIDSILMNIGTGFSRYIDVILFDNNKYLIGGSGENTYDSTNAHGIIQLNQDGSIYTGFTYGIGFNSQVETQIVDSNNKYLIGGAFTDYNGTPANRIIRLNQDGSVDGGFNYGTGFSSIYLTHVYCIIENSNNKYLVTGTFSSYNGTVVSNIILLNQDGSVDNTFNSGTGFDSGVETIFEDLNNKYLIGGSFNNYNGTAVGGIIRLNENGNIDTGFTSGIGFDNSIGCIYEDSNNKYLIGGAFIEYNGTTANRIIRLNQDGSIDSTFSGVTSGFNNAVFNFICDSNNKYVIGGSFTTYNGTTANGIIRLNQDGSIDNTFSYGIGFKYVGIYGIMYIKTIVEVENNNYLIGGNFTQYNGTSANCIIKLDRNGTPQMA